MSGGLWQDMHVIDVPWSAEGGEEYHGPHVERYGSAFEVIEWRPVRSPVVSVRVLTHTCGCQATVFELCGLGGGCFVRRTLYGRRGGQTVHESPMLNAGRAGRLWFELLRGRAR